MTNLDGDHVRAALDAVAAAARGVDVRFYDEDAMWIALTQDERKEADEAVIRLHEALVALDEAISPDR